MKRILLFLALTGCEPQNLCGGFQSSTSEKVTDGGIPAGAILPDGAVESGFCRQVCPPVLNTDYGCSSTATDAGVPAIACTSRCFG